MTNQIKAEAARDAAKLLDTAWGVLIPVDPATIARSAGLRVQEAQLNPNILGALVKQPGQDPTILLNQSDGETRKRVTCAHEIGHFVMRSDEPEQYTTVDLRTDLSTSAQEPEEIYANEFAACLLMPEDAVRHLYGGSQRDLEMAIHFGVPRMDMRGRLKDLNLAD